jgi:hypothetical protein
MPLHLEPPSRKRRWFPNLAPPWLRSTGLGRATLKGDRARHEYCEAFGSARAGPERRLGTRSLPFTLRTPPFPEPHELTTPGRIAPPAKAPQ